MRSPICCGGVIKHQPWQTLGSESELVPYAFNLKFEPVISLVIERIYAELKQFAIPEQDLITQYGPCVTILVVSDRVSPRTVTDVISWKLPTLAALSVDVAGPCMIPGAPSSLSLRVGPTPALLAVHHAIFTEFPEEEVHLLHRPAHWQPHLKLANFWGDREAASVLLTEVAASLKTFNGVLDSLEVIQYPRPQAIWQALLPTRAAILPAPS